MPPVTRSLGQLHFEDLEPHRFEDLIRALIYDFSSLAEATAIIGMLFFGESTNLGRVCSLVLLSAGLIGLRAFSGAAG